VSASEIDQVIAVIGMPALIGLTRVYGGDMLRVPVSVRDEHPLCVAIGVDAARKLCEAFPDVEIYVPAERTALIRARNDAIVTAYLAREAISKIARENRISPRMVRKILGAAGVQGRAAMVPP
jgi:hypothetical protein